MELYDRDYELMLRTAQKDVIAYRELVGKYLNFCVRFAERMLGNRSDAEDVAQDVCLKIWNEAPRWQPKAKFSTWLYRVVFNTCIDHKRKVIPFISSKLDQIIDEAILMDDFLIDQQRAKVVQKALRKLPPRQQAAVYLSYYEEITNREAAQVLEMDLNAFHQLLHRARQSLKESLTEYNLELKNA